ncbi:LysR family transcriptional regulator [Streptomyces sp. SL13]|uniref:LysR family transcriptional regulator n=1 Tax=Streptantibioticus silvisoli TaxID=2705255 RepID=A0AA90H0V5_9ACTN|nr:LysR family transcriptional regulator [Streptantibioticus silvisoli]MDI5967259.1 LysR family transcriptional regulator [Streptantibioticus silvisoli]MDI5971229.1 LysR family transcriptional regulator [Streptantibioticus silvisoli]
MLDTQQLAVLVGVARTGSYTAAARSLGYTQPAVSYRMRSLERAVGLPLVVRAGRGIRLTAAGTRLAEYAETLLAELRDIENELSVGAVRSGATVRVAADVGACVSLLPQAVARLRHLWPDVEVVIDRADAAEAYDALYSGDADLALVGPEPGAERWPGPAEDLVLLPLLTGRQHVLLPAGHALAGRHILDLADLAGEDWVLDRGRVAFLTVCRQAGFEPRIAATTDDPATAEGLVAHGVGVALAHGTGLSPPAGPRVVARPLLGWPSRGVHAVLRRRSMRLPAVAALLDEVRTAAEQCPPDV